MREIKFRGKCENENRWAYGFYSRSKDHTYITESVAGSASPKRVVSETVGEYTGIKINGEKIYEGDIIEFELQEGSCWGDVGVYRDRVGFRDGEFVIDYSDEPDSLANLVSFAGENWVKVIGNIYENPELLEVDGK